MPGGRDDARPGIGNHHPRGNFHRQHWHAGRRFTKVRQSPREQINTSNFQWFTHDDVLPPASQLILGQPGALPAHPSVSPRSRPGADRPDRCSQGGGVTLKNQGIRPNKDGQWPISDPDYSSQLIDEWRSLRCADFDLVNLSAKPAWPATGSCWCSCISTFLCTRSRFQ